MSNNDPENLKEDNAPESEVKDESTSPELEMDVGGQGEGEDGVPESEVAMGDDSTPESEGEDDSVSPELPAADNVHGEDSTPDSEVADDKDPENESGDNSIEIEVVDQDRSESEGEDDSVPPELPVGDNIREEDSTSDSEVTDDKDPGSESGDNSIEIEVVDQDGPESAEEGDGESSELVMNVHEEDDTAPASDVAVVDSSDPESEVEPENPPPELVMDSSVKIEDPASEGEAKVVDYSAPPENEGAANVESGDSSQEEDSSPENDLRDDAYALDDSAEQLYKQFAGIDDADRADDSGPSHSELMELLSQEEKKLDYYRLLLSQATCLFSEILTNSRFASLSKENDHKITVFINTLKTLSESPKFDGTITCRLRGQQRPEEAEGQQEGNDSSMIGEADTYDYQLSCGNILLDHEVAKSVEHREQIKGEAIYSKLMQAFKGMSLMNVFNLSFDLGACEEEDFQRVKDTIKHLLRYYDNESDKSNFFVKDEYGQPNINLTLLAATNKVRVAALQSLVDKIKVMMFGENPSEQLKRFTTVYDVILASKRYKEQLRKMPIEVNNMQTLMKSLHNDTKRTTEAVQVTRLVIAKYGSNPKMASEVISSINSEGYSEIRADVVGKRLTLATGFLKLTEDSEKKETLQNEALQNIEDGLDRAPDEIYDNINVEKNGEVSTVNAQGERTKLSLHKKLTGMIGFFKQRSTTKKKVRNITDKDVTFNAQDYAVIARNFDITELEASHLVSLMRNCFNDKGRFLRNYFIKNIPEFAKYDIKVFEFLWHYLKGLALEEDRVSFLNGLQLLVPQLNRPADALNVLLEDIFTHSAVVKYYDRNGLMLANILIRTKNREEKSNIELTPEEVLSVRKSLDIERVQMVQAFFEVNNEHLLRKVRHITEAVLKSSKRKPGDTEGMETRFLLHLNRELMIFLALVGGEKAKAIIHGLIREFGQPASSYYKDMVDKKNLKHSLQFLQVAAKALRRFNDPVSDHLFEEVAGREVLFVNLWEEEPSFPAFVKRIMDRITLKDGS